VKIATELLPGSFRLDWLAQVDSPRFVEEVFDHLKQVSFFAKDAQGRFTMANRTFVGLLRCKCLEDVLGRTDYDFFPAHIAAKYREDDGKVIRSGLPLLHEIEMVPKDDLTVDWHEANKFPIRNSDGVVMGIAGISVKLSPLHLPLNFPPNLARVLDHVGRNFGSKITVSELAAVAGMSERSLERHFVKTFGTTPLRYLKRVRLNAACHALAHTAKSIAEITLDCGFCDQSHMTSEFRRILGMTPRDYRLQCMGSVELS
jgi:AraC-like DNA-binding protein